jgi:colicin import membrane protein
VKRFAASCALCLVLGPAAAWAHGAGAGAAAPADPSELGPSRHKEALLELEALVQKEKLGREIVREPMGHAMRALERGRGALAAGDRRGGQLLERVAAGWIDAAREIVRAAGLERDAAERTAHASKVAGDLERARSLLQEQHARRVTLRAQLERAEADARGAAERAAQAERDRLERPARAKPPRGAAPSTRTPAQPPKAGKP